VWILDTNVISEMVAPRPAEQVLAWIAAAPKHQIFTTVISEAELFYGVERMPTGRRKDGLRVAIEAVFDRLAGRVLPFESSTARAYARLSAKCEVIGRTMSQSDAQITAIAIEHGATLVTRNTRDFANSDIGLLNPWLA
jgi:predicted nucleic acid-binding protein